MTGRVKAVLCVVMALAIFAVLVSPAVPTWPSVLRCRQSAHATFFAIMMGGMHLSGVLGYSVGIPLASPSWQLARSGPDVLDLTTARLC